MKCIGPLDEETGTLYQTYYWEPAVTGPVPGFTSVMTPAATAALMIWWRQ